MKIEIGLVIFCFALAVAFDYQEQQNNNGEQQQFSVLSSGMSTRRKKGTPPTQLSTTPGSCSEISYSLPNAENQTIYFRKTRIGLPSMAPCPNNPSKLFPKKDHFF